MTVKWVKTPPKSLADRQADLDAFIENLRPKVIRQYEEDGHTVTVYEPRGLLSSWDEEADGE